MIRKILTPLPAGKRFNRATIRRGEAVHSCLRWTPSFHEKYRTCHIPAQWNRRYEADEPGGARLGTKPENIFWCDGSERENEFLIAESLKQNVLIKLNEKKVPRSYLHRSNPNDVARVEKVTFICTPTKEEAGPTNNWSEPADTYTKLYGLLNGAMRGRTMFVVPYIMGPPNSPLTKVGFEITDSKYVVLSMRIMTRMGKIALNRLGNDPKAEWNRGVHSLLDVDPDRRFICHFPQDNTIISVGSGYGGNVLLSKKCFALRIGSYLARKQGWVAEHMVITWLQRSPAHAAKPISQC